MDYAGGINIKSFSKVNLLILIIFRYFASIDQLAVTTYSYTYLGDTIISNTLKAISYFVLNFEIFLTLYLLIYAGAKQDSLIIWQESKEYLKGI